MAHRVLPALAVTGVVAWSLLAFGGVYPWAALPIVVGTALIALVWPPRLGGSPAIRRLDVALLATLAAAGLQLVPLPRTLVDRLSPHLTTFEAAYRVDAGLDAPAVAAARPLSLSPEVTGYTIVLAAAILLLFWTTRTILARGGLRYLTRAVSWLGLLVALVAIVQRDVSPGLIYGWWRPLEPGAQPLGPLVNRNHFAGWLLMALPLTVGYLVAHVQSHRPHRSHPRGVGLLMRTADPRAMWLAVAGSLMLLVLVLSQSRSAVVSLGVSTVCGLWIGRRRLDARSKWLLAGYAALALAALVAWANFGVLVSRFDDLLEQGSVGRMVIWRDTTAVLRDFWLTGVGAGSYQTAMTVYQTSARTVFFNHAHNQYLQLAVEGGVLVSLPAVVAGLAFLRAAAARLRGDSSAASSMRIGALAGLIGIAVQSVWETGVSTPANAVLLAVIAAMVLHSPAPVEAARA